MWRHVLETKWRQSHFQLQYNPSDDGLSVIFYAVNIAIKQQQYRNNVWRKLKFEYNHYSTWS